MQKLLIIAIAGFAIGFATCALLSFTNSKTSNGKAMLVASGSDRGDAYFYDGTDIWYLNRVTKMRCKETAR